MNRYDLQRLAKVRLADAQQLFEGGRYKASFYFAGYVIEWGLKACIARMVNRYDFPGRGFAGAIHTHELTALLKTARLKEDFDAEAARDQQFGLNWEVVKEWKVDSRYEAPTKSEAENLLRAIADRKHGVLRWIKRHW